MIEPRWLDLSHTRVNLGTRLHKPVRLLHLSDLHLSVFVPISLIHEAIDRGLAGKPDLICVTGDFITNSRAVNPSEYAQALRRLSHAAPTFAVLGNHDGGVWARTRAGSASHDMVDSILSQSGIRLLHNASERVTVDGQQITIAGVGDLWSAEVDGKQAFRDASSSLPTILLAHNPDTKDVLADYRWDLMLSGHTHGGQIIVPFDGPRFAPVNDLRYVAGLRPWQDRQIYVTRGVGNLWSVRFRCRPEVSLLTLA